MDDEATHQEPRVVDYANGKKSLNKLLKGRITRWGFRTKKFVVLGLIAAGVLAGALLTHAGDMVPYHSKTIGQMQMSPDGSIVAIEETGIGTRRNSQRR